MPESSISASAGNVRAKPQTLPEGEAATPEGKAAGLRSRELPGEARLGRWRREWISPACRNRGRSRGPSLASVTCTVQVVSARPCSPTAASCGQPPVWERQAGRAFQGRGWREAGAALRPAVALSSMTSSNKGETEAQRSAGSRSQVRAVRGLGLAGPQPAGSGAHLSHHVLSKCVA